MSANLGNRLVLAKVELAEACERRDVADMEFRAAANRGDLTGTAAAWKRKQTERLAVARLVREIGELEAREAGLVAAFGPGAEESLL